MDTLRAMQLFVAVAETGSFTLAADREGLSAPAFSRQIAGLEEHLGARLLHRTTRSMSLTEAGQRYLARAQVILSEVAQAEAEAGQHRLQPKGLLRISAPLAYGLARMGSVLTSFREAYPELRLSIDFTDRMVDLVHEGIDMALRISAQPAPNLIARKLADVPLIACASPDYLARKGVPGDPNDLTSHDILSYVQGGVSPELAFVKGSESRAFRPDPVITCSNGQVLCQMAEDGQGITIQPDFLVDDAMTAGRLVKILPDWTPGTFAIYAVYTSRRQMPAKTRAFIDHLVAAINS